MWPFRSKFDRGLTKRAQQMRVTEKFLGDVPDLTMKSISIDFRGFYAVDQFYLGELCALILAQAQSEGACRVQLYYGNNRMVYTIDGSDYDMVPCPPPMNVDLVRAVATACRTTWDKPGALKVAFDDLKLNLTVRHDGNSEDPFVEITGFTGKAVIPARRESEPVSTTEE